MGKHVRLKRVSAEESANDERTVHERVQAVFEKCLLSVERTVAEEGGSAALVRETANLLRAHDALERTRASRSATLSFAAVVDYARTLTPSYRAQLIIDIQQIDTRPGSILG